jgi:hypothetical protein
MIDPHRLVRGRVLGAMLAALPALASSPAAADVVWDLVLGESPCTGSLSAPFVGDRTLYLTDCGGGIVSLEIGLESTFEEVVSITPSPGVQISGPLDSMEFCMDDPAYSPGIIATIVVRDTDGSGGTLCFVPSSARGRACYAYDCDDWGWYSVDWFPIGYSSVPGFACPLPGMTDCGPNPVEPETWGGVKSDYR